MKLFDLCPARKRLGLSIKKDDLNQVKSDKKKSELSLRTILIFLREKIIIYCWSQNCKSY